MLQLGDVVCLGNWVLIVTAIAVRQNRGMCAFLAHRDNSGQWYEVSRIKRGGVRWRVF